MRLIYQLIIIVIAYLMGSIPFGYLVVRIKTGKDIRTIESGRTGGTNTIRAAGYFAGLGTGILDVLKSGLAVLLVKYFFPDQPWMHALAGTAAVVGHNYSIFLIERTSEGKIRLRGGAGGAPSLGGAAGLWLPSLLILLPVLLFIWLGIGYASLATISTGIFITIIFAFRAWFGLSPWEYIFYGIFVSILLVWALRPNIKRLLNGTERLVGWRARKQKTPENHSST
jgi:acyl phosphate:glycerol-3-phosphate acyltransferase